MKNLLKIDPKKKFKRLLKTSKTKPGKLKETYIEEKQVVLNNYPGL